MKYIVTDGNHRLSVGRNIGLENFPCIIKTRKEEGIVQLKSNDLLLNPNNINEMTIRQMEMLGDSIKKEGILEPLIVMPEDTPKDEILRDVIHFNEFKGHTALEKLTNLISKLVEENKPIEDIANLLSLRTDRVMMYYNYSFCRHTDFKFDPERPICLPVFISYSDWESVISAIYEYVDKKSSLVNHILIGEILGNYIIDSLSRDKIIKTKKGIGKYNRRAIIHIALNYDSYGLISGTTIKENIRNIVSSVFKNERMKVKNSGIDNHKRHRIYEYLKDIENKILIKINMELQNMEMIQK